MKVLVSGSHGFVGRHMMTELNNRNDSITGVDIAAGIDARDFFRGSSEHFDAVIHLAAVVGGRQMIDGNPLAVAVDLSIDAEFWQWVMRTRPGHVIYFSSSAAYPVSLQAKGRGIRLREDHITLTNAVFGTPDMTYGWAKLTGEMQAAFAESSGVNVTVFRPFSGYGTDQALDYPFPSFVARALAKKDPFEIWGDGTSQRDWIHIDDIVQATMKAIDDRITGTYNLGTGRGTTFNALAILCGQAMGYLPQLNQLADAPQGVHTRVADTTLMNEYFTAEITLEEGIERAINSRLHEG